MNSINEPRAPRPRAAISVGLMALALGGLANRSDGQEPAPPVAETRPAEPRARTVEEAIPVDTEAAAEPERLSPEEMSRILRENLEETVREGERVLRSLPKERLRILRSRIANLERQVTRKEKERQQLQDSLALLRADYFRRQSAARRNGSPENDEAISQQLEKLKEDYDLHAESFEEELKALDEDLVEIRRTIERLRAEAALETSLRPEPTAESSRVGPSSRLQEIPRQLDPFLFRTYVNHARGRTSAPNEIVQGLRAEVAYRLGDLEGAREALVRVLEESPAGSRIQTMTHYNLACVEYDLERFDRSFQRFRDYVEQDPEAVSSFERAHVLAVLSYLNGMVGESRRHLRETDEERRQRVELVLGPEFGAETN